MKISNPLRRLFNREKQLAALNADLAATADIPEVGERLLRYRKIEGAELENDGFKALLSSFCCVGLLGGMVATFVGLMWLAPPIIFIGVFTMGACGFTEMTAGADADEGFGKLHGACRTAISEITDHTPLASFARSPKFDAVMQEFPKLKEKFMLSAARDKITEADALAAPQPDRKESLSL